MVTLLLGGLGYVLALVPSTATVASVQSADTGLAIQRRGRLVSLHAGTKLRAGDVISTQSRASLALELNEHRLRINLQPATELAFGSSSRIALVHLNRGHIEVTVDPRVNGQVKFITPQAEALVKGTHFSLAARLTSTWLDVFEGKVEFIRTTDGGHVLVGSHFRAVAAPGLDMVARPSDERWQTPYAAVVPRNRI
jgi:ferric-dicitrate binding protein FerR (iron transport regulator)